MQLGQPLGCTHLESKEEVQHIADFPLGCVRGEAGNEGGPDFIRVSFWRYVLIAHGLGRVAIGWLPMLELA
jgi:hypothetical protein